MPIDVLGIGTILVNAAGDRIYNDLGTRLVGNDGVVDCCCGECDCADVPAYCNVARKITLSGFPACWGIDGDYILRFDWKWPIRDGAWPDFGVYYEFWSHYLELYDDVGDGEGHLFITMYCTETDWVVEIEGYARDTCFPTDPYIAATYTIPHTTCCPPCGGSWTLTGDGYANAGSVALGCDCDGSDPRVRLSGFPGALDGDYDLVFDTDHWEYTGSDGAGGTITITMTLSGGVWTITVIAEDGSSVQYLAVSYTVAQDGTDPCPPTSAWVKGEDVYDNGGTVGVIR